MHRDPFNLLMIIAKTNPELTLAEHTEDVLSEAGCILARLRYGSKYKRLTGHDLRDRLLEAARYHDLGKAHPRWQRHAKAGTLINVGLRHELASLVWLDHRGTQVHDTARVAIAAHHNKLSRRHRHRWNGEAYSWNHLGKSEVSFETLWDEMGNREKNALLTTDVEELIRTRYEYDVVRSLLQLADRRASQIEDPGSPDPLPLRPFRYQFPHRDSNGAPTYRSVQRAVLDHADKPLLTLRSETGSGKTAAALLWAQEQVRAGRARRTIIALPTRFTSSSLASDVEGEVDTGLYHSSAWQQVRDDPRAGEKLRMARQFLYPLTVTTIDQVLTCLTGRREEHHLRFANLAHSCLIIDECDFYDEVVQANIERLMTVLRVLEVPVLVMSATLPTEHLNVYSPRIEKEGEEVTVDSSLVDTTQAGSSFRVASIDPVEDPATLPAVLTEVVKSSQRLIIYANTVARAVAYYDAVRSLRKDVVLYHSRFTEPHKAEKEEAVRRMLGPGGEGGVAIMTQIGEMSLNISAQVMISELCPIDRLAQRAGRLGRFTGAEGDLYLVIPRRDGSLYPAPYGSFAPNDGWMPASALVETRDMIHEGQKLTKADLRELTNDVYDVPLQYTDVARANADRLIDDLKHQWLIVPDAQMGPDDTEAPSWSSRLIGPQIEVFVNSDPLQEVSFTYMGLEDLRMQHAVTLPHYRLHTEPERFQWVEVLVEDEVEPVLVLSDPSEYTRERGLT